MYIPHGLNCYVSECAASAAKAVEPVKTAAPTLASVTPRPVSRATSTVRLLPSGIARPPLSLATAHGMLDRQYHLPRREDGAPRLRLPAQPYDLRHGAVSLWLNGGVAVTEVADRAGHSVEVLLRMYARCIDGGEEIANRRIDEALAA